MTEGIGMRTKSGDALALKGVEARGRIAGLLAATSIVQRYENQTGKNLEIAYTFPLPVDAVLLDFSVYVGERRYAGEVVPRRQAEEKYEQAIESGNSAFRLQAVAKGLYSATLGNVLAGESVRIEFEYAEPLTWNGRDIRYRLPTTLAPRYGEPKKLASWHRPESSLEAEYSLDVTVELAAGLARSYVASPSHRLHLSTKNGTFTVSLADRGFMDRDFILEIWGEGVRSLGVVASALDTHVAIVTFMPPEMETTVGRDALIVLDCSGSMTGDSIRLAKEGVQLALGHLARDDRFGLFGFGSRIVALAPALQPAGLRALNRARRFVEELGDLGGTELAKALEAALAYAADRPLDILLLTDGEAWDVEGPLARARELGARIFTVGIGSAVAEDTVRSLADQTGGACELVSPNEDMTARIERHFKRMRQPRILDVDIAWPQTPLWATRPQRPTFAGDAYTAFAAFERPVSGDISATVAYAGGTPSDVVPVSLNSCLDWAPGIVRVAAASRLPALDGSSHTEWAIRYQLLTAETDYIVALQRPADARPEYLPELHEIPHMLAAGWGGTGTVLRSRPRQGIPDSASYCATESPVGGYGSPFDWDVPAVFRCGSRRPSAPVNLAGSVALDDFLARLKRRARRRIFSGLPLTRKELVRLHLPAELLAVFDEGLARRFVELDVARALYAALLLYRSVRALGDRFVWRVEQLLGADGADLDLQEQFAEALEGLWDSTAPEERYHIPAFLRRQAD